MALVLAFKEGESFFVDGSVQFIVEKIYSPTKVKVKKIGAMDELFTLSSNASLEIHPNVNVFLGTKSTAHDVRLSFEAPRSIGILRADLLN